MVAIKFVGRWGTKNLVYVPNDKSTDRKREMFLIVRYSVCWMFGK